MNGSSNPWVGSSVKPVAAQDAKSGLRAFHGFVGTAFPALGDLGKEAEGREDSTGFEVDDVASLGLVA